MLTNEERIKNEIENLFIGQGKFLNAYAQLEFILLDLISNLRQFAQYNDILSKFPNSLNSRIATIRKLVEIDGPLLEFSTLLDRSCNLLSDHAELRHLCAHGFCKVLYTDKGHIAFEFRRYDPKSKLTWKPSIVVYSAPEFREAVSAFRVIESECLRLFRKVYDELKLEGPESIGDFQTF